MGNGVTNQKAMNRVLLGMLVAWLKIVGTLALVIGSALYLTFYGSWYAALAGFLTAAFVLRRK